MSEGTKLEGFNEGASDVEKPLDLEGSNSGTKIGEVSDLEQELISKSEKQDESADIQSLEKHIVLLNQGRNYHYHRNS